MNNAEVEKIIKEEGSFEFISKLAIAVLGWEEKVEACEKVIDTVEFDDAKFDRDFPQIREMLKDNVPFPARAIRALAFSAYKPEHIASHLQTVALIKHIVRPLCIAVDALKQQNNTLTLALSNKEKSSDSVREAQE